MAHQIYKLHWRGIDIEAGYDLESCCSGFSHLELRSINPPRAKLPMTETGYRSHFHPIGTIETDFDGNVIASVIDWLDKEAKSKEWQKHIENSKQLALF